MKILHAALFASAFASPAFAQHIDLSTTAGNLGAWQVAEVSNGKVVTAAPVYYGKTFGQVTALTFPFTDNDGYWYADAYFTLPKGSRHPRLRIKALGVDDRCVVELNGQIITDSGTYNGGNGYMTYTDGGANEPRVFTYASGKQLVKVKKPAFIEGMNDLRIIVNNTGEGILGVPEPEQEGGPTNVGILADIVYFPKP